MTLSLNLVVVLCTLKEVLLVFQGCFMDTDTFIEFHGYFRVVSWAIQVFFRMFLGRFKVFHQLLVYFESPGVFLVFPGYQIMFQGVSHQEL